jgi:3-hydroxyacyl-CoA dehydrogenase/enoyl-CoA hydratase/3-hydroxybutyryl-CoA epimerase
MKDVTLDAAARGMKEIWKGLAKQKGSGALLPFERDSRYGKIVPCDDYSRFKKTDIVIEAVFENIDLKRRILREVEDATGPDTIFASNTSALPIGSIAEKCRRPENVIGMHYFSPVQRMPLLEIITTKKTAPWVAATALDLGIRQGKTCIMVKDGPGFYTTRILAPLLFEAAFLIVEGAALYDIDRAMLRFGYPVGPIQLLDEVGIDVGVHVARELSGIFGKRGIPQRDDLSIMLDKKFLGRKSGIGMYRYDIPKKKGQRAVNEEVYRIFSDVPRREMDETEMQHRISLMMVNEAVYCLQEGTISAPDVGDIGAILGLGFPPFRGGPFRYIDSCGAAGIVNIMENLAGKHGRRFTPAPLLADMARKNKKFYK